MKRSDLPKRKSIRLKNYDYSLPGWYYVTICTQDRQCLFGDIDDGKMVLNNVGKMINKWWLKIPKRFENIKLDEFIIMPNHIHGIVVITVGATLVVARQRNRAGIKPAERAGIKPAPTLGEIVGSFKSLTTHEYANNVKNNNWQSFNKRLWQRNYYENIVRNENDLNKIRKYIKLNPEMWDRDRNNPQNQ